MDTYRLLQFKLCGSLSLITQQTTVLHLNLHLINHLARKKRLSRNMTQQYVGVVMLKSWKRYV